MKPQSSTICACDRCGRQIQLAPPGRKDAELFKLAKVPKGVCADCVMTSFLYNTYPINMQLDEAGPELLLNPLILDAFLMCGIMEREDMHINEVNWANVVQNWNLPVKVAKDAKNPYRMGDSPRARDRNRAKYPSANGSNWLYDAAQ